MSIETTIKKAIDSGSLLRIKYYPNRDGRSFSGWRLVVPIYMYTAKNKYVLCYQQSGDSSGVSSGFRLFFFKNIHEAEFADSSSAQSFTVFWSKVQQQFLAMKMAVNNQVE